MTWGRRPSRVFFFPVCRFGLFLQVVIAVNQVLAVKHVIAVNRVIAVNMKKAMKKAMAWCGLLSHMWDDLGSRAWARGTGLEGLGSRAWARGLGLKAWV